MFRHLTLHSSEPAAKRAKQATEEEKEEEEDKAAVSKDETAAPKKNDEEEEEDAVATNLTCAICREIMHDCLSLLPCLHNFCAGCYSQWSAQESSCPECRVQVQKVQRYVLCILMLCLCLFDLYLTVCIETTHCAVLLMLISLQIHQRSAQMTRLQLLINRTR